MTKYAGQCHCGNITVAFTTEKAIGDLGPRVCTCTYCQRQGARYTSDPAGVDRASPSMTLKPLSGTVLAPNKRTL